MRAHGPAYRRSYSDLRDRYGTCPAGGETLTPDELFPVSFPIRRKPALQASQAQTLRRLLAPSRR